MNAFIAGIVAWILLIPTTIASGFAGQTVAAAVKVHTFTPQDATYVQSNQGNCTDGTYLYQVLLKTVGQVEYVELQKICLSDWKIVKTVHTRKTSAYDGYEIHHGGDLCWNPHTGEIAAITYSNFVNAPHTLVFIDPETLLPVRKQTIPGVVKFYAIDYEPKSRRYVATLTAADGKRNMAVYDSGFKKLGQYPITPAGTTSALAADENHIYLLENDPSYARFARCRLHVFTWDGKLVKTIIIPSRGEIQDIYLLDGDFYIAFTLLEQEYQQAKEHMYLRRLVPGKAALLRSPPLFPFKNTAMAKTMIDWIYDISIQAEDWSL